MNWKCLLTLSGRHTLTTVRYRHHAELALAWTGVWSSILESPHPPPYFTGSQTSWDNCSQTHTNPGGKANRHRPLRIRLSVCNSKERTSKTAFREYLFECCVKHVPTARWHFKQTLGPWNKGCLLHVIKFQLEVNKTQFFVTLMFHYVRQCILQWKKFWCDTDILFCNISFLNFNRNWENPPKTKLALFVNK